MYDVLSPQTWLLRNELGLQCGKQEDINLCKPCSLKQNCELKISKEVADSNLYDKGCADLAHSFSSLKSANQVYNGVMFIIEMVFVFLIIFVKFLSL